MNYIYSKIWKESKQNSFDHESLMELEGASDSDSSSESEIEDFRFEFQFMSDKELDVTLKDYMVQTMGVQTGMKVFTEYGEKRNREEKIDLVIHYIRKAKEAPKLNLVIHNFVEFNVDEITVPFMEKLYQILTSESIQFLALFLTDDEDGTSSNGLCKLMTIINDQHSMSSAESNEDSKFDLLKVCLKCLRQVLTVDEGINSLMQDNYVRELILLLKSPCIMVRIRVLDILCLLLMASSESFDLILQEFRFFQDLYQEVKPFQTLILEIKKQSVKYCVSVMVFVNSLLQYSREPSQQFVLISTFEYFGLNTTIDNLFVENLNLTDLEKQRERYQQFLSQGHASMKHQNELSASEMLKEMETSLLSPKNLQAFKTIISLLHCQAKRCDDEKSWSTLEKMMADAIQPSGVIPISHREINLRDIIDKLNQKIVKEREESLEFRKMLSQSLGKSQIMANQDILLRIESVLKKLHDSEKQGEIIRLQNIISDQKLELERLRTKNRVSKNTSPKIKPLNSALPQRTEENSQTIPEHNEECSISVGLSDTSLAPPGSNLVPPSGSLLSPPSGSLLPPPSGGSLLPPSASNKSALPTLPIFKKKMNTKVVQVQATPRTKVQNSIFVQGNILKDAEEFVPLLNLDEIGHFFSKTSEKTIKSAPSNAPVHVIGGKLAGNIQIVFKKMNINYNDVLTSLKTFDMELIKGMEGRLLSMLPKLQDRQNYKGKNPLSNEDKFFFELMNIPSLEERLYSTPLLFHEIKDLIPSKIYVSSVIEVCSFLENDASFKKFLGTILVLIQFMNSNGKKSSRSIYGFKLQTLANLDECKGNDRKTSLLQMFLKQVKQSDPSILSFIPELKEKLEIVMSYESYLSQKKEFSSILHSAKKVVSTPLIDERDESHLKLKTPIFEGENELNKLQEKEEEMFDALKSICTLFCESYDSVKKDIPSLFQPLHDFIDRYEKIEHILKSQAELEKQRQKREQRASNKQLKHNNLYTSIMKSKDLDADSDHKRFKRSIDFDNSDDF